MPSLALSRGNAQPHTIEPDTGMSLKNNPRHPDERRRAPATPGTRRGWMVASLMALAVLSAALWLVKHNHPMSSRPPAVSRPAPIPARLIPDEKQVFSTYGGSASCRECHEETYDLWEASNHGLAERQPLAALDEPAFQPARTFQHGTQHTTARLTNGEYQVITPGPAKRPEPFAVQRVIGHDPLRQFLVKFPGGRFQVLEASYDPHRNEWFDVFGDEDRQPGEWGHWTGRGMNWNNMCAACHNTRLRKNYSERTDSYATTMAEMGVGCEACHGPLKSHNEWQKLHGKSGMKDPTVTKHTRGQVLDYCGFCHARRANLTGDFKPGDNFFDHAHLTIVDGSDVYYLDGQVREEDYEYTAFLGSRMHSRGVNCLDCHEPHSAKTRLPGNWLCLRCHAGGDTNAPVINPSTHSHHKVFNFDTNGQPTNLDLMAYKPKEIKETGGECVNCHMPQTVYMQRHQRHDHGFTIPDPLLTKQHGIPNACNRCHTDKDVNWALSWTEQWYGARMDRPSRRRTQTLAAARNGDTTARDRLVAMLSEEESPYWKAVAANLLERWVTEPAVTTALTRAARNTNALVRAYAAQALKTLAEGSTPEVETPLRRLLDDPVRNVRFHAAWALRAGIDPQSAAGREMLEILDNMADQPTGQMQKGAYFVARNDPQQALAHYQKAVEWDPNSAPIRHDLAVVLSGLNRSQEAVAQLEAACKLEPREAEYRYKLALAWNEAGNIARTIDALQTAVRLDAGHARAWYNLGLALDSVGRTEEALAALNHAAVADPADPRVAVARSAILARRQRPGETPAVTNADGSRLR